jgi:hypothetical protein
MKQVTFTKSIEHTTADKCRVRDLIKVNGSIIGYTGSTLKNVSSNSFQDVLVWFTEAVFFDGHKKSFEMNDADPRAAITAAEHYAAKYAQTVGQVVAPEWARAPKVYQVCTGAQVVSAKHYTHAVIEFGAVKYYVTRSSANRALKRLQTKNSCTDARVVEVECLGDVADRPAPAADQAFTETPCYFFSKRSVYHTTIYLNGEDVGDIFIDGIFTKDCSEVYSYKVDLRTSSAEFTVEEYGSARAALVAAKRYAKENAQAPVVEPAPEQAPVDDFNAALAFIKDIQSQVEPAPAQPHQEEESTMITLKRLSPAQLEIFSRAPHVTITGKHVTFEESNAPALITALEEMPGNQRTRMKCARRVKLATGQEVTIKKRAPAPSIPNTIKVRTSDAQRGVLQFINKRVCPGTIAAETVMHTFIHAGKVGEVITLLEDMHAMKVNTRACSSLIKTLEAHRVEQFTAAPLITAPAQDEWEEDEQFTIQFEETSARVHDPLHGLREVELPITEAAWGDAYTRVERTLNDYGYSPAGDRVTVARKHISGLLKQLELISVHGHINYDLETALDEELAAWGAAVE